MKTPATTDPVPATTTDPIPPEKIQYFRNSEYFKTLETQVNVYVDSLYVMARSGDKDSLTDLLSISLNVAAFLRTANDFAGGDFAENESQWPCAVPYLKDTRALWVERQVPPNLGKALPVDGNPPTGKGRAMNLDITSRAGFALRIMEKLRELADPKIIPTYTLWEWSRIAHGEKRDQAKLMACSQAAASLKPFSSDSIGQWVEAGMAFLEWWVDGDWKGAHWPKKLMDEAATNTSKYAKSKRGNKVVVRKWLKAGLESLAERAKRGA